MKGRLAVGLTCLALVGCGGGDSVGPTSDEGVDRFASWYRRRVIHAGWTVPRRYRAGNPSSHAAFEALIRRLCDSYAHGLGKSPPPGERSKNDPAFSGNPGIAAWAIMNAAAVCGLLD